MHEWFDPSFVAKLIRQLQLKLTLFFNYHYSFMHYPSTLHLHSYKINTRRFINKVQSTFTNFLLLTPPELMTVTL